MSEESDHSSETEAKVAAPAQQTRKSPIKVDVNTTMFSNNNVGGRSRDYLRDFQERQLTIDALGLSNLVVLDPTDINPILLRRYAWNKDKRKRCRDRDPPSSSSDYSGSGSSDYDSGSESDTVSDSSDSGSDSASDSDSSIEVAHCRRKKRPKHVTRKSKRPPKRNTRKKKDTTAKKRRSSK